MVTAAKRVITEPGLNTLGLKDKRDITRLVAQSALQVGTFSSIHPFLAYRLCGLLLLLSGWTHLLMGFGRSLRHTTVFL